MILKWLAKALDVFTWLVLNLLVRPTLVRLAAFACKQSNSKSVYVKLAVLIGQLFLLVPLILCSIICTPLIMWEGWRRFQAIEASSNQRQHQHTSSHIVAAKPINVDWKQEGF